MFIVLINTRTLKIEQSEGYFVVFFIHLEKFQQLSLQGPTSFQSWVEAHYQWVLNSSLPPYSPFCVPCMYLSILHYNQDFPTVLATGKSGCILCFSLTPAASDFHHKSTNSWPMSIPRVSEDCWGWEVTRAQGSHEAERAHHPHRCLVHGLAWRCHDYWSNTEHVKSPNILLYIAPQPSGSCGILHTYQYHPSMYMFSNHIFHHISLKVGNLLWPADTACYFWPQDP